jgi:Domain of unknown function (DUF397)
VNFDVTRTAWRTSSRSGNNGQCVEVALGGDRVAVRDSKQPARSTLLFSIDSWAAFVAGVRHGEFDLN